MISKRLWIVCIVTLIAAPLLFGAASSPAADEFFIISSVDVARSRLVLKRPTEVTVVMNVTGRTTMRGERGELLRLGALRAGDTIYAMARTNPNGELNASSIRRGPMTLEELHRRYLGFSLR
jgi:hypothetical protein